jgi:hypothetical protein
MNTYTFRVNAQVAGVEAQVVGAELERIESEHGVIDPHVVLNESRPEDAPLHGAFEWDDGLAAEKYRLDQARRVIRSVEIDRGEHHPRDLAFVNVPIIKGYVSSGVIATRPDLYEDARRMFAARHEAQLAQLNKLENLAPTACRKNISKARKLMETASALV